MQNIEPLNIKQLLQNPTGKYSAYMARRDRTIEDLNNRYLKLLSTSKNFSFKVYKNKEDYIFHFIIPSEEMPLNLTYDVVIQFCANEEVKDEKTINNYILKIFSNSPNFMFTYTYALDQNKMIVPFLRTKCSKLALTQAPTLKNPIEVYGFEKSIYFACRYIVDNNLTHKFDLDNNRFLFTESKIKSQVVSQEAKYEENKITKKKVAEAKRKKKSLASPDLKATNKAQGVKTVGTLKRKTSSIKTVSKTTARKKITATRGRKK